MFKSMCAEVKQTAAGNQFDHVCKASTSYEDAMKSVYGANVFREKAEERRKESKEAEVKAAEQEAPVEAADAQVLTPEEKKEVESKKAKKSKENTKPETAKANMGMITPFFQVPIDPMPEKKFADFGIDPSIIKASEEADTTTDVAPVVANQMEFLKGDMIANDFCTKIGATPEVTEVIKPVIAHAAKDIDNGAENPHKVWHDTYIVIANAIGIVPSEDGGCHMAHYFEETYNYYTNLIGMASNLNIPGVEPIPIMGETPVIESNLDPKKAIIFKKVYETAESLGLTVRVVPVNGLYRVDVFDPKTANIDAEKSFWADIDGKIMNRKQKWFPVYNTEAGKSFEDYRFLSFEDPETFKAYMSGKSVSKFQQVNTPAHIDKNRYIDMLTMPHFTDNNVSHDVMGILDRCMKKKFFLTDGAKSNNRYRIISADKDRIVMQNDAPIRYGYAVVPDRHIKLTICLADGAVIYGEW